MSALESTNFPRAAALSLLAYFLMALGIVAWKLVISEYGSPQILFIECGTSLPLFLLLAKFKGGFHLLKTSYPALQFTRGILQTFAAYFGLFGLLELPITTYTMLNYCTPFLMSLAAWIFLKEKCPPATWISISTGFLGVALVSQPEATTNYLGILYIILSCAFWTANVIIMRKMPNDHVLSFPFYTVICVGIISMLVTFTKGYIPMSDRDFSLTIIAGIFFFGGGQLLFLTYRLAPLYFTSPFQYSEIIWVGILSLLIWQQIPTFIQIIGLLLIIASTTYLSVCRNDKEEKDCV